MRSEAEAKAVLDQIAAADSEALAGIGSFVEPSVLGNMGTFYQVQLGPFADERSSLKTCNRLRRSGVDCFLVAK